MNRETKSNLTQFSSLDGARKGHDCLFIAAGGTGGHIFPALSIAQELARHQGLDIRFIGTRRGMEKRLIPEAGFSLSFIRARGWSRAWGMDFFRSVEDNMVGVFQSFFFIIRYHPRAVLAMGSYVSLLISFWAWVFRVPIYVQEQNIHPGLANRLISRWAIRVFASVEDSIPFFFHPDRVVVTGNPLRKNILEWRGRKPEAISRLGLSLNRTTILVMGGSLGSQVINAVFWEALRTLSEDRFQVLHVTGPEALSQAKEVAAHFSFPYLVYGFISEPGILYAAADVAICRSGANTTYELYWYGLPAILIPFEGATESHQLYNALWLQKNQPVEIIPEKTLQPAMMVDAIRIMMGSSPGINDERAYLPWAASRIADMIVDRIRRRNSIG
ncbi:MAG: UDP-N-acetylglucosamine--N-acetylmuramyl-(pentapeptide) pyrophosphoryl-undecaprenol N-acetylglucosamine transferase [Candidatus Atribacteria bacterium]|nr:UDP-N-acetylglucosamine--N-acetylmuramyl-(pentapeptide) pyrophosphoryl-undecaprenol N-acetylglucosamine transferase [Candidatus Atribacteria bacterium]